MLELFGFAWVTITFTVCVGAIATRRSVLDWLRARTDRKRLDDTVEIVRRRPLVDMAGHVVLVLMLAVPAAVLAGGGALPGPSGGGGNGLPRTGGTMTGQVVSSGVSVDWTSGTNEDLVFTPNGTGQCTCGTSFTGLTVTTDAIASAGESWASFASSDAPGGNGFIAFSNVDTTDARVSANMYMYSGGTAANKNWIQAGVTAANDSGSEPVLAIVAQTTIGGSIATRPLVMFKNAGTNVFGVYSSGSYTTGAVGMTGHFYTQVVSPAALSGTTNNYAGCTSAFCRIDTGAASRDLTGIAPLTGGSHHFVCNTNATNNIVLKHESGSSTAANRFYFNGATDRTIAPEECLSIIYDGTTARWRELK